MRYRDGQEISVGDVVAIGTKYQGTVVGCIESRSYAPPHTPAQWDYLATGILVDTDFGGIVHYPDAGSIESEGIVLVRRSK